MKIGIKAVVIILLFAIGQVFAQTNLPAGKTFEVVTNFKTVMVSNWIPVQERYVFIDKQIYDKYRSPGFVAVQIPAAATISIPYNGPIDATSHLISLTANWKTGQTYYNVQIKNFPFIRDEWNPGGVGGTWLKIGGGGCSAQAKLLGDSPSYNQYGVITLEKRTYDCGLPITTPYEVSVQRRVPVLKTNSVAEK